MDDFSGTVSAGGRIGCGIGMMNKRISQREGDYMRMMRYVYHFIALGSFAQASFSTHETNLRTDAQSGFGTLQPPKSELYLILINTMKHTCTNLLALSALLLTGCLGLRAATVVANFDGGNSTAVVDGYVGKVGDGWKEVWRDSRNASDYTAAVRSDSPLQTGTGNYLSVNITAQSGTAANKQGYVARMVDHSVLDAGEPMVISFLFRPEDTPAGSQDYRFLLNNGGVVAGTGAANLLWITGGSSSNGWQFNGKDGKAGNSEPGLTLSSGIPVVANHVYSFTLTVDIAAQNYTASITDLTSGASYSTPNALYFRESGSITNTALEFGALLGSGTAVNGQSLGFSIDSISVSTGSIPEPAAVAFLGGIGIFFVASLLRRRRQR